MEPAPRQASSAKIVNIKSNTTVSRRFIPISHDTNQTAQRNSLVPSPPTSQPAPPAAQSPLSESLPPSQSPPPVSQPVPPVTQPPLPLEFQQVHDLQQLLPPANGHGGPEPCMLRLCLVQPAATLERAQQQICVNCGKAFCSDGVLIQRSGPNQIQPQAVGNGALSAATPTVSYGPGVPNTPLTGKNNEQLLIRSGLHTRAPVIAQQQVAFLANNDNSFEPLQFCDHICLPASKIVEFAANGICGEELDCPTTICSEQKGTKALRGRRSSAKVKKCGQQLDKNANKCSQECGERQKNKIREKKLPAFLSSCKHSPSKGIRECKCPCKREKPCGSGAVMEVKGISLCCPHPLESCGQQIDFDQQGFSGVPRQDKRQRGYNGEKQQEGGNLIPIEHGSNERQSLYYNRERGYDKDVDSRQQWHRQGHDGNQRRYYEREYDRDENSIGYDRSQRSFARDESGGKFVHHENGRGLLQEGNNREFHPDFLDRNFRDFPPDEHGRRNVPNEQRTGTLPDGHERDFVEDKLHRQGFPQNANHSTHSVGSNHHGRSARGYDHTATQRGYADEANLEPGPYIGDSRDKIQPHYSGPSQHAPFTTGQGHERQYRQEFTERYQEGRSHQMIPTVDRGVHYEQRQRPLDASEHNVFTDQWSRTGPPGHHQGPERFDEYISMNSFYDGKEERRPEGGIGGGSSNKRKFISNQSKKYSSKGTLNFHREDYHKAIRHPKGVRKPDISTHAENNSPQTGAQKMDNYSSTVNTVGTGVEMSTGTQTLSDETTLFQNSADESSQQRMPDRLNVGNQTKRSAQVQKGHSAVKSRHRHSNSNHPDCQPRIQEQSQLQGGTQPVCCCKQILWAIEEQC